MPSDATQQIDPDRLQHDPEYRHEVIRSIASRFLKKAEEEDFDTTYEKLASQNPTLTDEVSKHVEAKVESHVEQAITKERLRRGLIRRGTPPRGERPPSERGLLGVDVGQVVALPKN